jgi:hypothetical protein
MNVLDPDQDSIKCLDLDLDLVNPDPKHCYGTWVCFALSLHVAYDKTSLRFEFQISIHLLVPFGLLDGIVLPRADLIDGGCMFFVPAASVLVA